jgi:hypothetical protein
MEMSEHRIQATGAAKPLLAVSVLVAAVIAGAALPRLLGLPPYAQQRIDRQIEREDGSLCERFGFAPGGRQNRECKAALADLRRQQERLPLH